MNAMRRFLETCRRTGRRFLEGPPWFPMPEPGRKKHRIPITFLTLLWLYALLDRILTPQGRMFGAVYLAIASYSLILSRSPAVILFFVLSGVLFFDLLLGLLFYPRIRITRTVPARVTRGCGFKIFYTVENRSSLPCFDLTADASLNMKHLAGTDPFLPRLTLEGKGTGRITRGFRLQKRGIHVLPRPLIETGFPFQIVKLSRSPGERQRIICHPDYTPLRSLRLPDGNARNSESVNSVASVGESMDFYGCREYRTGDDPRKIHWVASAKHAQFVVKEFQEEKLSCAALILDNSIAATKTTFRTLLRNLFLLKPIRERYEGTPFEAAVSLSASIATSLSSNDFVVDIFAAGSEIHHFRTGGSHMTQEAFLDLLASLQSARDTDRFRKITPEDIRTIASTGAVFLILLSIDPESEKLHRDLAETGVPIRTFFISSVPGPAWAETIRADDILRGKADEL